MKGLASSEVYGVWAKPVQLSAYSSVSITRASCALPDRRGAGRTRPSFSALRNIYHVQRSMPALLAWTSASPPCSRRERGRLLAMAGVSLEFSPATAVVLSSALSFVLLRAFVYFRLEYIIAAMVGRHVPRGGARVVELDIREGRNLYYYPSDTVQVVAVSTHPNRVLLENQAIKAGVPIQIKTRGPSTLGLPADSVDAVVSVYAFRNIPDGEITNVLREAIQVLRPGKVQTVSMKPLSLEIPKELEGIVCIRVLQGPCTQVLQAYTVQPFIFVEPVGSKNPLLRAAQNTLQDLLKLTGSKTTRTRDLLRYIQEVDGLEDLEYEEIFDLFDPHIVGTATKKESVGRTSQGNVSVKRGFKK